MSAGFNLMQNEQGSSGVIGFRESVEVVWILLESVVNLVVSSY